MTDKYAVVDATGKIVNIVMWDGKTTFIPGEGFSLAKAGEGFIIGGKIADGVYTPPVDASGESDISQPEV